MWNHAHSCRDCMSLQGLPAKNLLENIQPAVAFAQPGPAMSPNQSLVPAPLK